MADAVDLAHDRPRRPRRHGRVPGRPAGDPPQPAPGRRLPGRHRHAEPGRLRFEAVETRLGLGVDARGRQGPPVLLLHGLGATKAEFLPTVAALADAPSRDRDGPARLRRLRQAVPGGLRRARSSSSWAESLLDELGIDRAHVLGHSMGGRVAIEFGLRNPDRTQGLVLMTPSMAWLGQPPLGLVPQARATGARDPAAGAAPDRRAHRPPRRPRRRRRVDARGIDEFLRAYLTPRGRVAFYAAARQIYLEKPTARTGSGPGSRRSQSDSLFIWGRRDTLVPIGFERHVQERAAARARTRSSTAATCRSSSARRQTHAAIAALPAAARRGGRSRRPRSRRPRGARRARPLTSRPSRLPTAAAAAPLAAHVAPSRREHHPTAGSSLLVRPTRTT